MSDMGYIYPTAAKPLPKTPLVRVVENNVRTLPLKKISITSLEEPEDDVLTDAYENMVTEAAEQVLAKQIEEMNVNEDNIDSEPDPEVDQLLEAVIDDEGEYVREPKLDPITQEYVSAEQASKPHPTGEALMASDEDDIMLDDFDIDPVATFLPDVHDDNRHTAKANEENMKDTPLGTQTKAWGIPNTDAEMKTRLGGAEFQRLPLRATAADKQAEEKGTLKYLKSVEGRVLTVLEAAISSDAQREAVKTLIKKEFRREMGRVNRAPESDEE